MPVQVMPSPEGVAAELTRLPEYLLRQSLFTLVEVWAGFLIAVLLGVALALAIANSAVVDQMLSPVLVASTPSPRLPSVRCW